MHNSKHNDRTKLQVAFNTAQDIEFLKWLKTTHYTADMIDVDSGWDPDYESGTYYAWFTWELDEDALEAYCNSNTQPEWELKEQPQLDLDYTLCNISRTVRFP